jgi:hypothetical protein
MTLSRLQTREKYLVLDIHESNLIPWITSSRIYILYVVLVLAFYKHAHITIAIFKINFQAGEREKRKKIYSKMFEHRA